MSDTTSSSPTDAAPAAPAGAPPTVESASPGATARRGLQALIGDGSSNRPRLPMLVGIIDRLAGFFATNFRMIGHGPAEATADQPRPVRFAEFMATVASGSMIAVLHFGTWGGHCLAVIDSDMANMAVGMLLGGATAPGAARRGYTAIERAVVERLARDQIAANLVGSFGAVTDLDVALDYLASDAAEAAIALPPALCLTWRISVSVERHHGSISFLLPYSAMEPIRAQLSRDPTGPGKDSDPAWRAHLQRELPQASMRLKAVIERRRVSATEVLRWRVGSTLLLNRHHEVPIDVFCDDLLVLRARMAEQDGRIALHVEERRLAEDWLMDAVTPDT